ncbi:class I SAM-dependent methyltransferase [Nocardioides lianchengensis]|uniref:S-adenosyl-L-methionine-dependent methyltransferase n=1 Tax=Nocardioides lianchengensis TaxID=1045774 RepID=A0A1G6ULG1_9ACTN|nr:SAM-dependent methyltransferase [Nocardioides lianchengensis]NYG10951.1 methyltransferase (TIGR00027 family) [Nocardioides lianchengensis]SDD41375.1 methyltransferase, TIGR00027 family [Nocardioides lianchengensis]
MREGEPSRTAWGAAVQRALHQDEPPLIFRDPLAWRILGDDVDTTLWEGSRLRVFIAVRHRFAEDSLADAVRRGVRQVVVLGAGLDTFAYRNPHDHVRVWEVDHPDTQAWKRSRVAAAGLDAPPSLAYVPVDFERASFLDGLVAAGFSASAPAFFVWLGVVPYLTRDAVAATLRAIASVPDGEVVLDYTNPLASVPARERAEQDLLRARVADLGEPLLEGWSTPDLHDLLRSLGFTSIEDLGRPEIRSRYLGKPPGPPAGGGHVLCARV